MQVFRKHRVIAVLAALATALAYLFLGNSFGGVEKPDHKVESITARVFVASAKGRIDIEGGVVKLAARRDGVIQNVWVTEGERARAGQILASLDATIPQQNLSLALSEQSEAQRKLEPLHVRIKAAEREKRRFETLHSQNAVSRQELDKAVDERDLSRAELQTLQAAYEAATHRVAVAKLEVEERLVRAPADGQIIQSQAKPGNGVSTLNVTPLFLFAPDAPQIVHADLEERFLSSVHAEQKAEVLLEAAPEKRWEAKVLRLGRVVGQRPPSDDPAEKQDQRVVDCVLSIDAPELLIGQRVIVRLNAENVAGH